MIVITTNNVIGVFRIIVNFLDPHVSGSWPHDGIHFIQKIRIVFVKKFCVADQNPF